MKSVLRRVLRFVGPWLSPTVPEWVMVALYRVRVAFRGLTRAPVLHASIRDSPADVLFINLDHRLDRRLRFETEVSRIEGLRIERVKATRDSNGLLGCALSHLDALSRVASSRMSFAVICEDDADFHVDSDELDGLIAAFMQDPGLDVLCLGYMSSGAEVSLNSSLRLANRIQTTSCYVVKRRALLALKLVFRASAWLLRAGARPSNVALDILWRPLQGSVLTFAVPDTHAVTQHQSFSDIYGSVRKKDGT